MSDLLRPPALPFSHENKLVFQPTFFGGWRGIWLLTWKNQLTWRRAPVLFVGLLALPILVYLTTVSPQTWSERHSWAGTSALRASDFARRLGRSGQRLNAEQQSQLQKVFTEEYTRADNESRQALSPEASVEWQRDQINAYFDRVQARAQTVLDERQFEQFQIFEKRKRLESTARVNRPLWAWSSPFFHWLIDFFFFIILPLHCARACGALIRDELQANTLGYLSTRPLSRARLLVLKYLSQTAWVQMLMLVETLLLFAAGSLRHIPGLASLLPLFLAAQFLAVLAWSALGAFLGLVTKRYIALAMLYGFVVELGIGRIPTNINTLSLMRHLKSLLANNSVLRGMYEWPMTSLPLSLTALAVAVFLFLGLAALLFTVREYHPVTEMQK